MFMMPIFQNEKIEILYSSALAEIKGDGKVSAVILQNGSILEADGVFVSIGLEPDNDRFKDVNICQYLQINVLYH